MTPANTVQAINSANLQDALRNWRQGQPAPDALLRLHLLDDADPAHELIRDVLLYEWVVATTTRHLRYYLPNSPIPHQPETHADRLSTYRNAMTDALGRENDAAAWVALYYRWVLPDGLAPGLMAEAVALSDRHLRRQVRQGVRQLAQCLRRAEHDACRQTSSNVSS